MEAIRDLIADTARCLGLLSRFALSPSWFEGFNGRYDRAARAMSLAGALATIPAILVLSALVAVGTPPLVASTIAVAIALLSTGVLHEDGLADTADGLGSGEPEGRRQIMRDSSTGVYGVCAIVVALTLRIATLATLVATPAGLVVAWVAAAAIGRAAMVYLWWRTASVNSDGAAYSAGRPSGTAMRVCVGSSAVLSVPALLVFGPLALAAAALFVCVVTAAVRRRIAEPIEGHTGDILGATAVCAELAVLASLATAG